MLDNYGVIDFTNLTSQHNKLNKLDIEKYNSPPRQTRI